MKKRAAMETPDSPAGPPPAGVCELCDQPHPGDPTQEPCPFCWELADHDFWLAEGMIEVPLFPDTPLAATDSMWDMVQEALGLRRPQWQLKPPPPRLLWRAPAAGGAARRRRPIRH